MKKKFKKTIQKKWKKKIQKENWTKKWNKIGINEKIETKLE